MTLGDDATHIWITDLATNKPRQITKTPILATFVTNFDFVNNGKTIVAVVPPDGRAGAAGAAGDSGRSRGDDLDERRQEPAADLSEPDVDAVRFKLLEWHATGQIGLIDVGTGAVTKFGQPAMITAVDMNPTAKYARVTRMKQPFSYIVPVSSFGSIEEIWDSTGKALAKITERELNLGVQDDTPDPVPDPTQPGTQPAAAAGGRRRGRARQAQNDNGKRELTWRADGQGFTYLQLEPAPPAASNARAAATRGGGRRRAGGAAATGGGGRAGGKAAGQGGASRARRARIG